MRKILLLLLLAAIIAGIYNSPRFLIKGRTAKYYVNRLKGEYYKLRSEKIMYLTVQKGEIAYKNGKWNTPFTVQTGNTVIFKGMIISDDVISPDSGYVKNNEIFVKFKGANFPWK